MFAIGESGSKALSCSSTYGVPLGDMTDDLHVGILVLYLVDIIESTTVYILVWKLI